MKFDGFWVAAGIVAIALVLAIRYLNRYAGRVIYPSTKSYERARELLLEDNVLDESYIDGLESEDLNFTSPYGYNLYGRFYPADSRRFVIIVHGITMNIIGSFKYLPMFHRLGYNVVVYDQRNHGKSGGENTTFGHFEKWDLKVITDYLFKRFGDDISVGLHGESMGACVAILNMAADHRIAFTISDCGFSDLPDLLLIRFREETNIRSKKLLSATNLFIRSKAGFSIDDVSPIRELPAITNPILFIHGEDDTYIPMKMSKSMFSFKLNKKFLYTVKGAGHAKSYAANSREYEKVVCGFLGEVYGSGPECG